ncbi:hypothetical protein [Marivirga sp.]|uniref:hypothetical protein n=1 Tax=Marivirga sp. TaxID=2018662 RepID=UPI003DA71DFE
MKSIYRMLFFIGILCFTSFSCKEDTAEVEDCGCDSETIEIYENVRGTISRFKDMYYITLNLEDNKLSLQPCEELNTSLKNVGLEITFSGEMKKRCTLESGSFVFTPFPFIIKNISESNQD